MPQIDYVSDDVKTEIDQTIARVAEEQGATVAEMNKVFERFAKGFRSSWTREENESTQTNPPQGELEKAAYGQFEDLHERLVGELEPRMAEIYARSGGDSSFECSHIKVAENLERMFERYADFVASRTNLTEIQ